MPRFRAPDAAVARVVEPLLEPVHADEGLGHESRRGLYHVAAASHRHGQQQRRHLGGKLVLPALAGDLHGEGQAFSAGYAVHDSAAYLHLVLSQRVSNSHGALLSDFSQNHVLTADALMLINSHGGLLSQRPHYNVGNDGGQNNQHQGVHPPLHLIQLLLQIVPCEGPAGRPAADVAVPPIGGGPSLPKAGEGPCPSSWDSRSSLRPEFPPNAIDNPNDAVVQVVLGLG